jgi:hypothetical protein
MLIKAILMTLDTEQDHRTGLGWKSSPLALLFHGLDRGSLPTADGPRGLMQVRDMERVAKIVFVRLDRSQDG